MRKGFTMIELIFVIVILGILAAVAIPRLSATRDDAEVSKGAANLATLMNDLAGYYTSQGSFTKTTTTTGGGAGTSATATWGDVTSVRLASAATGADLASTTPVTTAAFLKVKDKGCVQIAVAGSTVTATPAGDGICTQFKDIASVKEIVGTGTSGKKHELGGSKVKF
ncbi:prepilin-type N-terminal cleavage/methylation domain-containing protein [Campylobacter sp. RM15925]|uniref:prepilin-type N-terminal cleavage/methylation domain-containing protein n=1 Tax=Campylobacter sp. RM15925 TaxID=1705724 RepID=UPI00201E4762|nr:prepilin-type N-terminal cleavage/methylation domain-containing protein [Campylobacter sp. RM15925]